jgi:hypothetical protein
MTRLLLYAVTPADARCPAGLRTLLGTRVAVVHAEQDAEPPADREAVLAFGRTIERIAHDGPALPMRFGTTVADLQELRLLIAEHEEAWAARLEAVAGCCELIVHLDHTPAGAPRPAPGEQSGREYLLARAEAVHSGDAVRDEIRAVLRPWLREARSLTGAGSDRMAVLVPHAAADRARTRLERWAADRREIEVAVTGPWPPFSFCEAAA